MCQPKQLTLEDISSLDLPKLDPSLVSSLHRIQSPIYLSHPRNFDLYLTKEEAKDLTFKCWKKTKLVVLFKGIYIGWIDGHAYTKEAARPAFRKFFEQLLVRIRIIKSMDWRNCPDVKLEPSVIITTKDSSKTTKPDVRKCLTCGVDISDMLKRAKFCSKQCANAYWNLRWNRKKAAQKKLQKKLKPKKRVSEPKPSAKKSNVAANYPIKTCPSCNTEFKGRDNRIYCSAKCCHRAYRKRLLLKINEPSLD